MIAAVPLRLRLAPTRMLESYEEAKARHDEFRLAAYESARRDAIAAFHLGSELQLADIDARAIYEWRRTWAGRKHATGTGGWNWTSLVEQQPRRATRLTLAIWYGGDLCGLVIGRTSRHRATGARHTITLTHAERRPEPPDVPLRGLIIPIAAAVARRYGAAVGATRLRLGYPDPKLLRYYELLGFEVAWEGGKPVYCEQEI